MNPNRYNIKIDTIKELKNDYFIVTLGDINSHILDIEITQNGEVYNLTGLELQIDFSKADNKLNQQFATIINAVEGKAECILEPNSYNFPGRIRAEVRIIKETSILTTKRFEFYANNPLLTDKIIESTTELPLLKQLILTVTELLEEQQIYKEDENVRVGNENNRIDNEILRENLKAELINLKALLEELQINLINTDTSINDNEGIRIINENARIDNEVLREQLRTQLETLQGDLETLVTNATDTIDLANQTATNADNKANLANTAADNANIVKLAIEELGVLLEQAEALRETAEQARKDAESLRVTADNDRMALINSKVSQDEFNQHKLDYTQLNIGNRLTTLEEAKIKRYGVRRVLNATTPAMERLYDAVGLVANADTDLTKHNVVVNNFDKIYPWSHMKNVIIEEGTGKRFYQGEAGYDTAIGDWVVEIPKFLLKHTNDGINEDFIICALPLTDYKYPDVFYNDDGKLLNYIDIARFKTSQVNGKPVSRPNTFPQVVASRTVFRTQAIAKGLGWQLEDVKARYVLEVLYKIEFANLNSQAILGSGVTSVRYTEYDLVQVVENNTNRVVLLTANANNYNVGEAISIGTVRGNMSGAQYRTILAINIIDAATKELVFDGSPISILASYKVYQAGQILGKTIGLIASSGSAIGVNNRSSVSYRGIEDIFGNMWEWIDGILINDYQSYVCNKVANYGDVLNANFLPVGYANHNADGYIGEMGHDKNYPFVKFPINVTGGSTTKYCDYYYQNTGLRAPVVGGVFHYGVAAGLFYWYCYFSPDRAYVDVGSRLLSKPLV